MFLKLSAERNVYKYKRKIFSYLTCIRNIATKEDGLRVLFFGTDNFSLPSIKVLHSSSLGNTNVSAVSVVTSFKRPFNCIKCYAERNSISIYEWPVSDTICRQHDLGVVVSFGHMIPEILIRAFPLGMINVHASLLPRWRGAAPIIYSIMRGDTKTGVSIMRIEPNKFDIGDILAQKEVQVGEKTLMPELHDLLANEGAGLLHSTLKGYPESFKNPKKQNDCLATYAPKIMPSVAEVNWKSMLGPDIYNLYRALYGYRNLSTKFEGLNIKLVELQSGPKLENCASKAGSIKYVRTANCLRVLCKDSTSIDVLKLKVEGRRTMSSTEFSNGFLKKNKKVPLFYSENENI